MKQIWDPTSLSKPIPTWVRVYGFGALMLLMVALISFSFFFEIERVARVSVSQSANETFIKCSLDEFETIRRMDTVTIRFDHNHSQVQLKISKNANLIGSYVTIPAFVVGTGLNVPFRNGEELEGYLTVERSTLLSKVFEKAKPPL